MIKCVTRFKAATESLIDESPRMTFDAKMVIRRQYDAIDSQYLLRVN